MARIDKLLEFWINDFLMAFFIILLFSLANVDIQLEGSIPESVTSKIALRVMADLFLEKQIGIFLYTWLGVKLKLGTLPSDLRWGYIYGLGALAGIEFAAL